MNVLKWPRWKQALVGLPVLGIVGAVGALALTYRSPIPLEAKPSPQSFSPAIVEKGEALARIGDCSVCHTSDGGAPFAGGRALATPFGTLYSTNLTPDEGSGIGAWSFKAFERAMHDGVSRDGRHLYPALPYEHFTHVKEDDLQAIYAFLMTRRAVETVQPANELIPPLGFRPLLAGWKMLFLHGGVWQDDPKQTPEWNRGAYLVEGLGHCGGCHTPRNLAGGEMSSQAYDGGVAEGWSAPALNSKSPAKVTWTTDQIYSYLRTGLDLDHSVAAGPMGPVTHNLARAPDADVKAISVYVWSLQGSGSTTTETKNVAVDHAAEASAQHPLGASLFAGACAGCHAGGAPMVWEGRPSLALASPVDEKDPSNVIQVLLQGIKPPTGSSGPYMPALGGSFTDAQLADITAYVRARYSDQPAWTGLDKAVNQARQEGQTK